MIHDGFSTIPAHMDILNKAIRKSFSEMYRQENLLYKFVIETLGEKKGKRLWKKFNIQQGELDLSLLTLAEYFFA